MFGIAFPVDLFSRPNLFPPDLLVFTHQIGDQGLSVYGPCTELSLECYRVLCDLVVLQHELCGHTSFLLHTVSQLVACTEVSLEC